MIKKVFQVRRKEEAQREFQLAINGEAEKWEEKESMVVKLS